MKIEYVYIEVGHDTISNLEIIGASYNAYMLLRGVSLLSWVEDY